MKGFWKRCGALTGSAAESVAFALAQLKTDRFRTVLSLSGIAIGIFSTVAVLTLMGSLRRVMEEGLAEFGKDVVLIETIPLEGALNDEGEFRWWDYANRPPVSREEYLFLAENARSAQNLCFSLSFTDNPVVGVAGQWQLAIRNRIASGRPFTAAELSGGAAVALVGADYAREHEGEKSLVVDGRVFEIIGIFERSGISAVSLTDTDASIVIPMEAARTLPGAATAHATISAQPKPGVSEEAFDAELRRLLRSHRRLSPGVEDNFALNRLTFILRESRDLFSIIDTIGWIVGLFSLLIGGFGIANILFVAVRERTRQIGLQKALGATRGMIAVQFLTEAATLSLSGGVAGLAAVWLLTQILRGSAVPMVLSPALFTTGLMTALLTGIAAGMAPAIQAANLAPAVALSCEEA